MTPELNRVHVGDVLEVLRGWPDGLVHTVVTSPPYFELRDYGVAGQIGLEESLDSYVAKMVEVFREVRRVLRPDGTLWLNIGDSYAGSWGAQGKQGSSSQMATRNACEARQVAAAAKRGARTGSLDRAPGLKNKDLMMVPARVALALQADGWWLRSRIAWAKGVSFRPDFSGTCMPESAEDRPTNSWEEVFLFAKSERYFYDAEAVKEKSSIAEGIRFGKGSERRLEHEKINARPPEYWTSTGRRNLRSVWAINPRPFKEAHFATFPVELPDVCVRAGSSEKGCCGRCGAPVRRIVEKKKIVMAGDGRHVAGANQVREGAGEKGFRQESKWFTDTRTVGWKASCACKAPAVPCRVLDPFGGAGTTGLSAARLRRDFLLVEISEKYAGIARRRIAPELSQAKLDLS